MGSKPALAVMAAGMGSRYGGLKQMDPVTENGEVLLDFSVYDALRAGFEKIVLIIKHEIERDFDEMVGKKLRKQCDIVYAYQELNDVPIPVLSSSAERKKPWGTGHAVLAARNVIDTPFAVINADDYYGKSAFEVMAGFLRESASEQDYAMVGYQLGNTLTDHGSVARGICTVENGFLRGLTERTKIIKRENDAAFTEDGENWSPLPFDTTVSMQMFGFHPSVFKYLADGFNDFLTSPFDPLKGEYLLPSRIGELVSKDIVTLRVLESPDRWFGVTYKEDKPAVVEAIRKLREKGVYPENLW